VETLLLGIYPLPAGYLWAGPAEVGQKPYEALLAGCRPAEWTPRSTFFLRALEGRTEEALQALGELPEPSGAFNRFVLAPSEASFRAATACAEGEMAEVLAAVGYALGYLPTPPTPGEARAERLAFVLVVAATEALERGDLEGGLELLGRASEAAASSPLFQAQIEANRADVELQLHADPAVAASRLAGAIDALAEAAELKAVRAELAVGLGTHHLDRSSGNRAALLEAARWLQVGLRDASREREPELYATGQQNLALAYLSMPLVQASDHLRQAVAVQALKEARSALSKDDQGALWSQVSVNLANAIQHLPSTHPRENLAEAVEIYEEVLGMPGTLEDPLRRARVLANQGNALAHLGIHVHAVEKLREAGALFEGHGESSSARAVDEVLAEIEAVAGEVRG
jgi:tetratricopeptide (TPR) repeat protein